MSKDEDALPERDQAAEYAPFPGQPGYRTRSHRSGLDYVDNVYEYYYELGLFIRYFFTGRLRTTSPALRIAMAIIGIVCLLPAVAVFISSPGSAGLTKGLFLFLPLNVFGIGLLLNLLFNLISKNKSSEE